MSWEHYDLIKSEDEKYLLRLENCGYDSKIQFEIVDINSNEVINTVGFYEKDGNIEIAQTGTKHCKDVTIPVLRDVYKIDETREIQSFKIYRNDNGCLEFIVERFETFTKCIFDQFKISDEDNERLPILIAAGLNAMFEY